MSSGGKQTRLKRPEPHPPKEFRSQPNRIAPGQKRNRAAGKFTNSRGIIDTCRPYSWRDQYLIANMSSKEYMAEAMEKFGHLLE